jgi:putative mRNA 3-end processing factor
VLIAEMIAWWQLNAAQAAPACCTATRSARRSASCTIVAPRRPDLAMPGPIIVHGAVTGLNRALREAGVDLPPTMIVSDLPAPVPALQRRLWWRRRRAAARGCAALGGSGDAFASGWMQLRGTGAAAAWIAALRCRTTPTGPACCRPSPPPARSA